ncbi:hypothetical protein CYLTODRAFT_51561 [Cylindrobasidium torrendii FP15055 ss-10]|uniref:BTB domain-containing protein n=1 Tax=Cylindrobasidium torrendii FP15055 ss-10 TaxID=1314674 RepID=A0A0D7B6M7_9AGAR|nr:hypothetical protein CYLTODRAFT_51561 [Cylindrobasidium torrendii FP15055 ss-10]
MSSRLEKTKHSSSFYLPDGNLHILVGEVYYRVHRYFFIRESVLFRTRLEQASKNKQEDGKTEGTSIILSEFTTPEKFDHFLWVFYNSTYDLEAPREHWEDILELADKWSFAVIKSLAIRKLEAILDIPVIDRIVLYRQHNVPASSLNPYYARLCARDIILSKQESTQLGLDLAIQIFQARERLRSRKHNGKGGGGGGGPKSPLPDDATQERVMEVIAEMFL